MTPRVSLALGQGQTASEAGNESRVGLTLRGLEAENNERAEIESTCVCPLPPPPHLPTEAVGRGWVPPGWFLNTDPELEASSHEGCRATSSGSSLAVKGSGNLQATSVRATGDSPGGLQLSPLDRSRKAPPYALQLGQEPSLQTRAAPGIKARRGPWGEGRERSGKAHVHYTPLAFPRLQAALQWSPEPNPECLGLSQVYGRYFSSSPQLRRTPVD